MLTRAQQLSCDLAWYKHRLMLLKVKKSEMLSAGTVEAWNRASAIADSVRRLEFQVTELQATIIRLKYAQTG